MTEHSQSPVALDPAAPFDPDGHDHRRCVDGALATAERLCQRRGARLTALRRRVLELVWRSHAPVGAYELMDRLARVQAVGAAAGAGGRVAPPTVYRALEFLLAHGLIHRIESLNAYIGCCDPEERHAGQFLLCRACGRAAELHDPRIAEALDRGAGDLGFTVERETVELSGLCPTCREPEA